MIKNNGFHNRHSPLGKPNLVTNGDFSNGTTGWSAGPATTTSISVDAGRLKVTTNSIPSSDGALTVVSGLVVGLQFRLAFQFIQGNRPNNNFFVNAFAGLAGQGGFTASGDYAFNFTANTTSATLTIRNAGSSQQIGDFWFIDNVSVRAI
jgi:hypothetical protein